MTMVGFFHIFRDFAGKDQPQRVNFAYAAPAYSREYARVFEQLERFDQPFTGIQVDRGLLKAASPHKDEDIHDALRTVVERRMPRLPQQGPCALRVRELLIQRGWPDRLDMEIVARTLGYSVRSLRRRLAEEGKSYRAVENDAFAIVAKQRLRDEQRTIQEAAYELGFSDTTTFHRAFKRSTGTTPMKYREQQRGKARRG
jgi:AraC-like DNA-binding protein